MTPIVEIFEVENAHEARLFVDWLLDYEGYPFAIIVNWATYEFRNKTDKLYFAAGIEAILDINGEQI